MRIANLDGRLTLLTTGGAIDVAAASRGRFGPDPQSAFDRWVELHDWTTTAEAEPQPFEPCSLRPPVPAPRQVFAIGLNYADHAAEIGVPPPSHPQVFTKFASCLTGPAATVVVSSEHVDWEIELVIVIGRRAENVTHDDAWSHVAGLMVGQDLSDRRLQMRKPEPPQYSLGKSRPGFGPTGPSVVTVDEFNDPEDLALTCRLNGVDVQHSRTSKMVFPVPELIARLSAVLPLLPGDLIFTGTPGGIGALRTPPRFLTAGDELTSTIEGIGTLTTRFSGPVSPESSGRRVP